MYAALCDLKRHQQVEFELLAQDRELSVTFNAEC